MFQITVVKLISKKLSKCYTYFKLLNLGTDNTITVSLRQDKWTSKRKQRVQSASAYHVTHFMISTLTNSFQLK